MDPTGVPINPVSGGLPMASDELAAIKLVGSALLMAYIEVRQQTETKKEGPLMNMGCGLGVTPHSLVAHRSASLQVVGGAASLSAKVWHIGSLADGEQLLSLW